MPAILILVRTPSIINYVGRYPSLLCLPFHTPHPPHYPVELLRKLNLWGFCSVLKYCFPVIFKQLNPENSVESLKKKKKICPVF